MTNTRRVKQRRAGILGIYARRVVRYVLSKTTHEAPMDFVDELRGFNRYYTREIGLLEPHLPESDLTLAEARVLYELAQRDGQTAADLSRTLAMDKAQVSRILVRLGRRGYVRSHASPEHAKRRLLFLTDAGRTTFAALDRGARDQMEAILRRIEPDARPRLIAAVREVRSVLGTQGSLDGGVRFRKPAPGDLGFIAQRQMLLYAREYGWDWTFEGLVCEILAKFIAHFDDRKEDAWIAERGGAIVGSVFLMRSDDPATGKLRLLYVEPNARGLGIGRQLVDACVRRASELGYAKVMLWTNDVLVSARRIYQTAGFVLAEESPHHSFGHDLIGQTWTLDLGERHRPPAEPNG
jgi:DNA-binding MarR family transcriptional regulator/GNAT superfamily N-acetyltransferase